MTYVAFYIAQAELTRYIMNEESLVMLSETLRFKTCP